MNTLQSLGDVWAAVYVGLLAFNALVAITCLIAGPRLWARRLCGITTQANLILILGGMAFSGSGLLEQIDFGFDQFLWLFLPVLCEFLALWAISRWRLGNHSTLWIPSL